jgi:hypothetical protein
MNHTHPNLRSRTAQKGQSLVELAVSMIIILLLLLGAVEFGMALFQYVTIRDAAQEGALYGSINPEDETGIIERTIAAASDMVALSPGDVDVSWSNDAKKCEGLTGGAPHSITVTITYNHAIIFPLIGPIIGDDDITLTGSVTDTILSPACDP